MLNKYPGASFNNKKFKQHSHYVCITIQQAKSSHDMPINLELNKNMSTMQNFQHVIRERNLHK